MVRPMKTTWFIPFLALGCAADSKHPGPDGDTGDTAVHTIWSGWNHTWGLLSHRLSLAQVRAGTGNTATSGILGGDWSTGESWSDDVNYRIHQQDVEGSQLQVEHGMTTLIVGPDGSASGVEATEMLDDAQLVVLQGFEITTDVAQDDDYPSDYDPALGYTSRGFGMGVSLEDGQVHAEARVSWGPRDRPDVNGAIPFAQTGVTVYWTAINGIDALTETTYNADQERAHSPPNSPQAGMSEPVDWAGTGVSAIRSFDLSLTDTDGGTGGDYLRSFGAEVQPSEDGGPPGAIGGEILTTAPIELGTMSMAVSIEAVWIPLDPELNTIRGTTIAGTHPVGSHTIPVD